MYFARLVHCGGFSRQIPPQERHKKDTISTSGHGKGRNTQKIVFLNGPTPNINEKIFLIMRHEPLNSSGVSRPK